MSEPCFGPRLRAGSFLAPLLTSALIAGAGGCATPQPQPAPDRTPPAVFGVNAASVSASSATILWTTDEPANSQVDYGTTTAYGTSSPLNAALTTSHAVALSGLAASTLYYFRVRSTDSAGNVAISGGLAFATTAASDTTPPVIAAVSATAVTATGAVVAWTTDEPSDSSVDYGTTAGYGQSLSNAALTTAHAVAIAGLAPSTLYHVRARSRDAAGNEAASGDVTFTTANSTDTTAPSVSIAAPASGTTVSGTITIRAEATDDVGVAGVQFLLDGANLNAEVQAPPFTTAWNSAGVANGTHAIAARARDAAGNQSVSASVSVTVSNASGLQLEIAPPITGFTAPLDLQSADDGSGRMFVVEQGGRIKVVGLDGQVLAAPLIDIATRPGFTSGGESGLLGLAVHPNFATNGRFFVNYTRMAGAQLQTVVAEFTAVPAGSNVASGATERVLFTVDQPFTNHNGGGMAFGADGFLYIGLGDGGSGGDPLCNGQNLNTLLGKILRIDVDGARPAGQQYVVPPSNPFANQPNARGEIWVYGLRNPFRFSFDKANLIDLYIGDVGQNAFEEVDLVTSGGANLGWSLFEGTHPFSSGCSIAGAAPTGPIFDYSHAAGDSSVTGGYVYRGASIPDLAGVYVFGDFVSGRVWTLSRNAQGQWIRSADPALSMGGGNLSAFGQSQDGELWVVRYSTGEVARIRQRAGQAAADTGPGRR